METPYAVAPQERSDWQGASRIMVLYQICDLVKQTLCFVSPREQAKRSLIGKKQSYKEIFLARYCKK